MTTITKAGRYELREELGRGAMGVVYRAHDPVIGRDVAVKTIHLSEAGTGMSREELVSRFQTEARAAGLLTHPNIVVIYDAGEEEGLFYITMEMVEGRSLQTMFDSRQSFPLPRVMKVMEQVCSALDFAHQHGVVHRDVKPANLMLTADDAVKITDFGTAKILQFGTAQTAHVMGTPSYMSPEQVKGKPVDGRSDIFSLGVILYELVTGEKPFPGQNITTVIYKIINEEPVPPRSLDASIHPGLSAVIARALAKDPSIRFQSCHELLDALKNYREQISPEATIKMPVASAPVAAGGIRSSAPPVQPSATALTARPQEVQNQLQLISAATLKEEEASKKRKSLLLSVILLGIIGFAGYRVWPAMVDLWQRTREPEEKPVIQPKQPAPAPPAVNSEQPDTNSGTKPDSAGQTVPAVNKPAPPAKVPAAIQQMSAPESQQTPAQTPEQISAPAPVAPAKSKSLTSQPEAQPDIGNVDKSAVPQKPVVPSPTPITNAVEIRLRAELVRLSIAEKVKVEATANALTLTGRVTPAEHRMLLNRLHWVPTGVRIIDDLGYTDVMGEASGKLQ